MGFLKDIQDMPNQYDYSLKFFDRYYRPEYTTIVVVGDVKPKAVRATGGQVLGRVEARRATSRRFRWNRRRRRRAPASRLAQPDAAHRRPSRSKRRPTPMPPRTRPHSMRSRTWRSRPPRTSTRSWWCRSRRWIRCSADCAEQCGSVAVSRSPRGSRRPTMWITCATRFSRRSKAFQEKPVDAARLDTVRKRLRYSVAMQHGQQRRDRADLSRITWRCGARRKPSTSCTSSMPSSRRKTCSRRPRSIWSRTAGRS